MTVMTESRGAMTSRDTATQRAPRLINALARIPLSQLRPDPRNPRRQLPDLDELARSIAKYGIRTPLLVQAHGPGFLVVDGHRRLAAAARAHLAELPCILITPREGEALLLERLLPALHQRGLDPIEEGMAYRALLRAGMDVEQIADAVCCSVATVRSRLELCDLPPEAQQLVSGGAIPLGEAQRLARQVRRAGAGETRRASAALHFTSTHPLARHARARCDQAQHPVRGRIGRTACGACWEDAIREDAATTTRDRA